MQFGKVVRAAFALVVVSVAALALVSCGRGSSAPRWAGAAYTSDSGKPSLLFPATTGGTFDLPTASAGAPVVLVFGALRNRGVARFLATLKQSVHTLSEADKSRLLAVFATTDAAHDTLVRLQAAVHGLGVRSVGVRGTYPLTEVAARTVALDVEPVSPSGSYPVFGPQAVGFTHDGHAAVAWDLTANRAVLEHDLRQLTN